MNTCGDGNRGWGSCPSISASPVRKRPDKAQSALPFCTPSFPPHGRWEMHSRWKDGKTRGVRGPCGCSSGHCRGRLNPGWAPLRAIGRGVPFPPRAWPDSCSLPLRLWVYTDLIPVSPPTLQVLDWVAGGAPPISGEDQQAWLLGCSSRKRLRYVHCKPRAELLGPSPHVDQGPTSACEPGGMSNKTSEKPQKKQLLVSLWSQKGPS